MESRAILAGMGALPISAAIMLVSADLAADPRRELVLTVSAGPAESADAVRRAFSDGGWVLMRARPDTLFAMPYRLEHLPYIELALKVVLTPADSGTRITLS